jgi:hypothetical protein
MTRRVGVQIVIPEELNPNLLHSQFGKCPVALALIDHNSQSCFPATLSAACRMQPVNYRARSRLSVLSFEHACPRARRFSWWQANTAKCRSLSVCYWYPIKTREQASPPFFNLIQWMQAASFATAHCTASLSAFENRARCQSSTSSRPCHLGLSHFSLRLRRLQDGPACATRWICECQ